MRVHKPSGSVLPTDYTEPISELSEATMFIYGRIKIGKTSLAAQYEDPLFCLFEPGGKSLRIKTVDCKDWKIFKRAVRELEKSDNFRTVVIDTVKAAYEACTKYICEKEGVEHPTDVGGGKAWGKGYGLVNRELNDCFKRIEETKRGLIYIAHSTVETSSSRKAIPDMIKANLSTGADSFIRAVADIHGYYRYYEDRRFLTIKGTSELDCGTRLDKKLNVKDGSRKVASIPMGDSPQEAYENLLTAFNNEQELAWDIDHPNFSLEDYESPKRIARKKKRKTNGR